ncbi:MlaD family protein [Fluviispira multicolorata]|uniref:MCE family protein n=1 Tax=Fluviispira multicolorata TaxID=2654512 RepID=A0A833N455_9BACT|nr:MlaD family protein [Fluviispira multicolorata]KAB8029926.1 MCE family protein [Fluviispira multicolorata]
MSMTSELKVGLFAIVGASVLTTTAFVLGGNPFASKKQHFHTILNNVGGVAERTQIRASGVRVGEVTSVEILPDGARVNFDVDSNVKIPSGSYIEIKSRGILGDVYIEVVRNLKGSGEMKSGEQLQRNPESNDMETLMTNLNAIARDIKKISGSLANVLGTSEGETSIKNIVANIEGMTNDLREVTGSQKENLKDAIQGLRDTSVRLSKLIERNDSKIDQIIADVKTFTTELRQISTPENREKIESIITSIEAASASIKRMAAKVENGEGTLGQLIAKEETADEVKATLKSIQDAVRPISQLKLTVQDRAEARLANAVTGDKYTNELNLLFSTRPDRYYLLGVTNAAYARKVTVSTATTTTTSNGSTVTTTQENKPEDVDKLRYNLQVSQRFGFMSLRLGLFSSSAGLATDFYAFNDKLVGTVEISQFNGVPIPSDTLYGARGVINLKAFVNYFITPNFFVTGGVDGLVISDKPFPFLGAGISISDDDLKGLVGIAAIAK